MFIFKNQDESIFEKPNAFNPRMDTAKFIIFGAAPYFCAGAQASKALILYVAVPMLVETFPSLTLRGEVIFNGWAFRGPIKVLVEWKN